jgi:hypothetical protein
MKTKAAFRGLKLQMAIRLVAQEDRTDEEIAKVLRVNLPTLQEAAAAPYFAKRVEEERLTLRMERDVRAALVLRRPKKPSQSVDRKPFIRRWWGTALRRSIT